ncbi:hypothetical protein OIU79_006258 [Salix purpurea]|uniref:Uncharacterized protein n=1 Tax=Salix purpurea TaxID=77065 RepID=A0A9Q0TV74_SALPP|nr:hypothetical protein OIU79_006258 [Salix purpurea]
MALKKPPVINNIPICADDCCNDRESPCYCSPPNPFVNAVSCPQTDSNYCKKILQSVVSLHGIFLLKQAPEALKQRGKLVDL